MDVLPIWTVILGICGGIITIFGAVEKLISAKRAIHAPAAEQDRRIKALEERCDRFEQFFHSDKQRLNDLEQSLSVLMQGTFALLSHAINGNDVSKLREVRDNMFEYLSKRGISV